MPPGRRVGTGRAVEDAVDVVELDEDAVTLRVGSGEVEEVGSPAEAPLWIRRLETRDGPVTYMVEGNKPRSPLCPSRPRLLQSETKASPDSNGNNDTQHHKHDDNPTKLPSFGW